MQKKAQVSIEYTLIIGLVILTLTISVAVALYYSASAKGQIRMNQLDKIGKKIVDTSDSIYYLGPPSKATIELTMPDRVASIIIVRNLDPTSEARDYIRFDYYGSSQDTVAIYYIRGRFNGTTEQPLNDSRFKTEGLKKLKIEAVNENGQTKVYLHPILS